MMPRLIISCVLAVTTTSCASRMMPLGHPLGDSRSPIHSQGQNPDTITTRQVASQPALVLPANQVNTLVGDRPARPLIGNAVGSVLIAALYQLWDMISLARSHS